MGFKEKVFRLSTYKERGTNAARKWRERAAKNARIWNEYRANRGAKVARKWRECVANIVQTLARMPRENGDKVS
jgi:hypothetical protein